MEAKIPDKPDPSFLEHEHLDIVDLHGTNVFRDIIRQPGTRYTIHIEASICGDIKEFSRKLCVKLLLLSGSIGVKATDIGRGRLQSKVLKNNVTQEVLYQIENLYVINQVIKDEIPKEDIIQQNLPVLVNNIQGIMVSPEKFDACVGMRIGSQPYFANVVLEVDGSRWLCKYLQLG